MTNARLAASAAALIFAASVAVAGAATPAPSASPHAVHAEAHLPIHPLHSEYLVEVNKKGQVVKIKSGVATKDPTFNTLTFGNALQMWIRKPDGSATVGLFKVTYDYDPKTHKISRHVALVKEGGDWGDAPGAATAMMLTAEKEAEAAAKQRQKENASLPSLNQITGKPTIKPSPTPTI